MIGHLYDLKQNMQTNNGHKMWHCIKIGYSCHKGDLVKILFLFCGAESRDRNVDSKVLLVKNWFKRISGYGYCEGVYYLGIRERKGDGKWEGSL